MEEIKRIPLNFMPRGWAKDVAIATGKSESLIKKIAYGTANNQEIFDQLLEIAEAGRKKSTTRIKRLHALTK